MVVSGADGDNPEFTKINDDYQNQVRDLLGEERFVQALDFQRSFNDSIPTRFGSRATLAGIHLF